MALKFDVVGEWSELKIKIVAEYAKAYSTILKAQSRFTRVYIALSRDLEDTSPKRQRI